MTGLTADEAAQWVKTHELALSQITREQAHRLFDLLHDASVSARKLGDRYAQACHLGDREESRRRLLARDRVLDYARGLESDLRAALLVEWAEE